MCLATTHAAAQASSPPPLQLHMSHYSMPCSCTGHIATPSQLHGPCRCPHCSRTHLAAAWALLLPPLQPYRPCCRPPRSHTCLIAACLAAAQAMSPPPHSCTGYVAAPIAATHISLLHTSLHALQLHMSPRTSQLHTSPCALQLHRPRCCPLAVTQATLPPPCSHTGHIVAPIAATHAALPCTLQPHRPYCHPPSQPHVSSQCTSQLHRPRRHTPCSCTPHCCPPCSGGTWAYWLLSVAVELVYLFIIAEIYLLNLIMNYKHDKHFMMNYKVFGE
jgi:hypothetical protein